MATVASGLVGHGLVLAAFLRVPVVTAQYIFHMNTYDIKSFSVPRQ